LQFVGRSVVLLSYYASLHYFLERAYCTVWQADRKLIIVDKRAINYKSEGNNMVGVEEDNGLIRWAKRKIGSIWRTSNNNKRHKINEISIDVVNSDNKFLSSVSGLPLTRMISYLEPCDVLNCIQTCRKWKTNVDKDEIWCEVAKSSVSSRNAVDAIIMQQKEQQQEEEQRQQQDNDTADTTIAKSKLNYRNVAIAISRRMNDYEKLPYKFPESKLNLKDVLLVIEMRYKDAYTTDNYKHLGSFCSDLTELTESQPGESKYIEFDSDNDTKKDRFSNIFVKRLVDNYDQRCDEACNSLEMRLRLIRRDTGKCICINDYESGCYRGRYKGLMEGFFLTHNTLKLIARNPSGAIAREVCFGNEYNYIAFNLDFAIDRISDLEYKIKSFDLKLKVSQGECYNDEDEDGEFNCMNHFLLYLEGLDWK
jgi:hypothetical protein